MPLWEKQTNFFGGKNKEQSRDKKVSGFLFSPCKRKRKKKIPSKRGFMIGSHLAASFLGSSCFWSDLVRQRNCEKTCITIY